MSGVFCKSQEARWDAVVEAVAPVEFDRRLLTWPANMGSERGCGKQKKQVAAEAGKPRFACPA